MTQKSRVPGRWRLAEDFEPKGRCVDPEFLALGPEGCAPHVELEFVENWQEGDWGQVLGQDFRNMADVQRGMHSRGFEGLWLNTRQEMAVHDAHRIADRFLFGEP